MSRELFNCPECGSTKSSESALVETEFSESDIWSGVLQRHRCAKCGLVIPAHLAELWDGMSPQEAVEEWHNLYRATAPKDVAD
ncbi:MAG TPA: hypothetical protein VLT36_02515 [Candidatus Dormibacteraeota bacterium]|nr:hypothetical protein [Candidatus Dormibacteraeota bacterium]